jgi:hypothetical protein
LQNLPKLPARPIIDGTIRRRAQGSPEHLRSQVFCALAFGRRSPGR